jgi:hypothetical protein
MGFFRRLFGLETQAEKELRRLKKIHDAEQQDYEMRAIYTALIRDTIEKADTFGYSITCIEHYELFVISLIQTYTPSDYVLFRIQDEELAWKALVQISVRYPQKPHGQKEENWDDPLPVGKVNPPLHHNDTRGMRRHA